MNTNKLVQFTNPEVLRIVGHRRLDLLFSRFSADLANAGLTTPILPDPDVPAPNGEYFDAVAALFAAPDLPERFSATLATLEHLASTKNAEALDAIIQRRLSCIALNRACPLDCALEVFFACPDELLSFSSSSSSSCQDSVREPSSSCSGVAIGSESAGPSIEHQESSNQHPDQPDPLASVPIPGSASSSGNSSNSCESVSIAGSEQQPIQNQKSKVENPEPSTDANQSALDARPSALDSASLPPGWVMQVEPWPDPVNGAALLESLRQLFNQCVVLPPSVAELLPLFVLHTYAFQLRDISVYLGIESPIKRCGKTTLLKLLLRLVNRPVVSANVSSSSFFHVIQDLKPTLMIDEADRFLKSRQELQGIMNAGYTPDTAYVVRMGPPAPGSKASSSVNFFFVWCPKVIAQIGHLPDTLADRCIVFRMQRKVPSEELKSIRELNTMDLRRQCARFVLDHAQAIAAAKPPIPKGLNDRAADIWEPLFALADIAGGEWPNLTRNAAVALAAVADENSLIGSLLLDIFIIFCQIKTDRIFGRDLVDRLNNCCGERPWLEPLDGKPVTDRWLARQLRPYGIRTRTLWINDACARGYLKEDFTESFRRYIANSDYQNLLASLGQPPRPDLDADSGSADGDDRGGDEDQDEGLAA